MNISDNGLDLIKEFEGFSSEPYRCSAGVPTIGYGSTYYVNGEKVSMEDNPITEQQANSLLRYTVDNTFSVAVNDLIKVDLNQNQFDALVSFTYNLGAANLESSTLLKLLNQGKYEEAADEFPKWRKAGGKVLAGLENRRKKEKELFLSQLYI